MILPFFRKYQRYIFLVVTVVIVISFSFFGTYSTITREKVVDPLAFTAVNGSPIYRSEQERVVRFISSDAEDQLHSGKVWGANFLNDGVIEKDLLETGLAEMLVRAYWPELKADFETRREREQRFAPYVHPEFKFLTAEAAWENFAPELSRQYQEFERQLKEEPTPEQFATRVKLYLAQRDFSPALLSQVLRYQEQQQPGLTPDAVLAQKDLAIFGYHSLEDWFGPSFLRLMGQFVINASTIAEQKGFFVAHDEALAQLFAHSERSFIKMHIAKRSPYNNSQEYMQEQLRHLGIERAMAVNIWEQILRFRRLFDAVGNAVFVDALPYKEFNAYAQEGVKVSMYELPEELRFGDSRMLQKFEVYLDAVAPKRSPENLLTLPTAFLSIDAVERSAPELVQKRYLVKVAEVNKAHLQASVGIKDMWAWELEEANWKTLQENFPELSAKLGAKQGEARDDRFAAIEALDDKTRERLDTFSRTQLVSAHPEWVVEALAKAPERSVVLKIRSKGGNVPLPDVSRSDELAKLLDQVSFTPDQTSLPAALEAQTKLQAFQGDNKMVYRITLVDRAPCKEILTFAEAKSDATLDKLLDSRLKTTSADSSLRPLLSAIKASAKEYLPEKITDEFYASYRFYAYANKALKQLKKDPADTTFVQVPVEGASIDKLAKAPDVTAQWKLKKKVVQVQRRAPEPINNSLVFAMPVDAWSVVSAPATGAISFYQVLEHVPSSAEGIEEQMRAGQRGLSDDARRYLMADILPQIQEKKAIVLTQ